MAFYSPKANAMTKSGGYNPRPPNLEKFYGFLFTKVQRNDKIWWLQPKTT